MKTRFKFAKQGYVKFVGHLDTVRLFQRAIKVAGIPIAYSQGFNPHSLVYFAMPLSVGVSSSAEYMDIVTSIDKDPKEMMDSLNRALPPGLELVEAFTLPEQGPSLMSLVEVADYVITLPQDKVDGEVVEACREVLAQEEILVMKKAKAKKGRRVMKEVDIKPMIRTVQFVPNDNGYVLNLQLAAGSTANLSPELLLKALTHEACIDWDYSIHRAELYAQTEEGITPINRYGVN